jgi:DNA-binding MarR family transcriptional regulator
LLVSIYNSVDVVESKMFKRVRGLGVTMSEARIIQIIGDETFHTGKQISVSQIAAMAMVKTSSMTIGFNRLVDRGFLTKERDETMAVVSMLR